MTAPPPALFEPEDYENVWVLTPQDNLGELNFQQLSLDADRLLEVYGQSSGRRDVVIDFGRTSYFGSSTISVLLRIWKRVSERNSRMALCNLSPDELEILEVVRLHEIWPICGSREAAIAAVTAE